MMEVTDDLPTVFLPADVVDAFKASARISKPTGGLGNRFLPQDVKESMRLQKLREREEMTRKSLAKQEAKIR